MMLLTMIKDRTASDKIFRDKAYEIAKDPKYYGSQTGLASLVYKSFDKKTAGSGFKTIHQNEQLAKELHKPIIKKLKKKQCIQHSKTIFVVMI